MKASGKIEEINVNWNKSDCRIVVVYENGEMCSGILGLENAKDLELNLPTHDFIERREV